jgi:hypothetical protein
MELIIQALSSYSWQKNGIDQSLPATNVDPSAKTKPDVHK